MVHRRNGLAARRVAVGLTQAAFADAVGVTRSTAWRWEALGVPPSPTLRPRIAEVLQVSLDELDQLLDETATACRAEDLSPEALSDLLYGTSTGADRRTPDADDPIAVNSSLVDGDQPAWKSAEPPTSVLEPPWSHAGTIRVLRELLGGSMDRRGFLIVSGITLADLGDRWGCALTSAERPSALAAAEQPTLSATVLDRLDRRVADLRQLDDEFGGRDLRQLAVAEFDWLTRLADQANYGSAVGRRLFSLVTEAARLCGWLHFDAAHHAAAQTYYVAALRCSATANDSLTGAHVLACMSFQATLTGNHQEAIALIDSAEERTKRTATPRLRALLASRKARAYAKAGDAASCGRALNEAERRLDATMPETPEPSWIYYFDDAELDAQAAACWVDLLQPGKARPLIDKALRTMDPHYIRDRTIYHVRSAEAHLHAGDLETACDDLHTAADLAGQTGSVRAIDTIRSARKAMSCYERDPRVRTLDRHLAGLAT